MYGAGTVRVERVCSKDKGDKSVHVRPCGRINVYTHRVFSDLSACGCGFPLTNKQMLTIKILTDKRRERLNSVRFLYENLAFYLEIGTNILSQTE